MNDPLISCQEDFNHSSERNFVRISSPSEINQLSLQPLTMSNMLVQQQRQPPTGLRSSNITIHHPSKKSPKDDTLHVVHSVDERLFLYKQHDSNRLLQLFNRFASEPHMPLCHIDSTDFLKFQPAKFSSTNSSTNKPILQFDVDDLNVDEKVYFNCDIPLENETDPLPLRSASPIPVSVPEATPASISVPPSDLSMPENHIHGSMEDDTLTDASPNGSSETNDMHGERHFRRRKRRSSLTRTSVSIDETTVAPLIESLEKLLLSSTPSSETVELNPPPQVTTTTTTTTTVINEQETNEDEEEEKAAPVSRYRGRRLRHRFYRQSNAAIVSAASECSSVQFHLQDPTINRVPSPPPTDSPAQSLTPCTPESITIQMPTTPPILNGALKRMNSSGTRKKMVHFADSVGKELTEVQYIRSTKSDSGHSSSSKELSFLLPCNLLSSSPPPFSKSDLYLPSSSLFEHKPWSFDVAFSSKQCPPEKQLSRRFFCLYRQPNSEHPDIYLHEIWKRQIKLEHAEIPSHHSSTGEQYLIGTVWVTNAAFSKYVAVKYTFNRWLNTYECEAQYRRHSNDFRNMDLFEFHIDIPVDVDRVEFVLRYCVNGQEYWDNNDGKNYTLQTESANLPANTISLPHDCDFNEMRFY